jgi:hypothetical protein
MTHPHDVVTQTADVPAVPAPALASAPAQAVSAAAGAPPVIASESRAA